MRKIIKITSIVFIIVLLIILGVLYFFLPFHESNEKLNAYFLDKDVNFKIHEQDYNQGKVRFLESSKDDALDSNLVVFVHGAPGSSSDFKAFLCNSTLLGCTKMISIDRLGYGNSQYGIAETDIGKQAALIHFITEQYNFSKLILVGHSYGGPIVAKYAMDYPDLVDEIIMLAPLNDPKSEPIFRIGYITKWPLTRWIFPKELGVASDEKFSHVEELLKMQNDWKSLRVPIIHIHGKRDILAPFSNIEYSKINISSNLLTTIILNDANHFLPWTHFDLVRSTILKSLKD